MGKLSKNRKISESKVDNSKLYSLYFDIYGSLNPLYALKNSNSDSVIKFKDVLKKIINGK